MSPPHQEPLRLVGQREPSAAAADGLPKVMNFDDTDSVEDVIDALALSPFIQGDQPFARSTRMERVRPAAPLRPADARLLRTSDSDGVGTLLAAGDGWTLRATRWQGGAAQVQVTAVTDELAREVLASAVSDAVEEPEADEARVDMGFWHMSNHGGMRRERAISTACWPEISGNYAAAVAEPLARLMAIRPAEITGRLLLLHGPPGTGKTTALRSLAREWSKWCQVDCVLDPEVLFSDPGYLMQVAVGVDGEEDGERRWRLLVLEDCDELIRGEAKASTGQGLSRLLNLTDGMLGQGRDVLVAITTNEDVSRLHPAVVRPGRCLAQLEVGRLSRSEALAWLAREMPGEDQEPTISAEGATLAELVALRNGDRQIAVTAAQSAAEATGFYL